MAEGDEPPKFVNDKSNFGQECDSEEPVKVDHFLDLINLGSDKISDHTPEHTTHGQGPSHNDPTVRREENPFSFKHFLRNDKNYQNLGARPKVFCEGRPVVNLPDQPSPEPKHSRIGPEFSSALPDFVQDHLVIEQCYLGNNSPNGSNANIYNLPDFTPTRSNNSCRRLSGEGSRNVENRRDNNSSNSIPLDLPIRPQVEFPLDLPIGELQTGSRSCPPTSEVGNSKSLPDFLADGAVKTQNNDCLNGGHSPERDGDRLRQELDLVRRQLNEQIRRGDYLSREVEKARKKELEYTQNLAKALEQVEENLERSNMRAASSESTILKLRQEVKAVMNENNILRRENDVLKNGEGASGGPSYRLPSELQAQRFGYELRQAANTAEHSLRQLLTGVDNLRMLASSVESMGRVEKIDPYQSDPEDDTGPAL